MIPIEIQDKIFLYFDYENLERTRELQSNYVKDKTKFSTLRGIINCIYNFNHVIKYNGLNNIKWLLNDQRVNPAVDNNYAIRSASLYGLTDIVKLLLVSDGVDPTANNNDAIRLASYNGNTDVVKLLLLDPRVDPSANDNEAIQWASLCDYTDIVKLLSSDTRVNWK
jgi:hypothetical protein